MTRAEGSWIFVGLGGNVGGAAAVAARFGRALRRLRALPYAGAVEVSSLYRTAPLGPVAAQPPFLNAVVALEPRGTVPTPSGILADLLAVEAALGRRRDGAVPQGPREIDLDLLLVGDRVARSPGPPPVVVPHPRLGERAFALAPLAELAGASLVLPGAGVTVAARLADPAVAAQRIERLETPLTP